MAYNNIYFLFDDNQVSKITIKVSKNLSAQQFNFIYSKSRCSLNYLDKEKKVEEEMIVKTHIKQQH